MTDIVANIRRSDGALVRMHNDGHEEVLAKRPVRPMSDEEILAAAESDPDARPLTQEQLEKIKRVPRAKIVRRALGLTRQEFAMRFHIPLGTLKG